MLQKSIEKKRKQKKSLMERLELENWRTKETPLEVELVFGKERKLCKKNITLRTKLLIQKFNSKKRNKEGTYLNKILNTARETAGEVKLDYEEEND